MVTRTLVQGGGIQAGGVGGGWVGGVTEGPG